jgi:hypothetical protein
MTRLPVALVPTLGMPERFNEAPPAAPKAIAPKVRLLVPAPDIVMRPSVEFTVSVAVLVSLEEVPSVIWLIVPPASVTGRLRMRPAALLPPLTAWLSRVSVPEERTLTALTAFTLPAVPLRIVVPLFAKSPPVVRLAAVSVSDPVPEYWRKFPPTPRL